MPQGYLYTSHGSHVVLFNCQLFRSNVFKPHFTMTSWLLSNVESGGMGSLNWVGAESGVQCGTGRTCIALDCGGAGPGIRS